jgi:two-component system, sensor histidine kinase RegB
MARAEIASSPAAPGSGAATMLRGAASPSLPPRGGVRLRALVLIRWAAVAGQFFTAAVVHWGLGFSLPLLAVGGAIMLSALLNLTVSLGRPASARIDDREATFFLAFDILQLAVLLYLTGGLINPFALLLLAPVAIGATILSLASNIALSLLTIASIALLGVFHQPLPWRGPPPELPEIYLTGVWAGLTLTTLLITLYGWRLAEEARQMADALAAAQAALAREQRLSALGALAAAAAHELGSPLSTIAVVTKEMLREVEPDDPLREDVELLSAESERCRAILARLSVDPAGDVSDAYTLVPLPALIEAAAQNYQREGIAITFEAGPIGDGVPTTAPIQVRSPEIMQGIGNIVQNAVSFARREVTIVTRWTSEWSQVEVSDDGPGFSQALLDELGTPFISTRQGEEGHMGLGVFIAKTLLERTGATVIFGNRSTGGGGGAAVSVRWPNPVFKAT